MLILKRLIAVCLASILFVAYWAGFIIAENDAYTHGHNGFVHDPTGILLYVAAVLLSVISIPILVWLWE
jgi:hypothetical protein